MKGLYNTFDAIIKEAVDPRTNSWPLVADSRNIVSIICLYLCCIYIFLPLYMKHREPYNLKQVIFVYNVFQIVACSYLVFKVATSGWTTTYTLGCQLVDYSDDELAVRMAKWVWWHLLLKLVDMIETVFYVLRKKTGQVSILHVYHHIYVVCIAWVVCKFCPGGMITFTIVINGSVHVLMYCYYLLASLGPLMQGRLRTIKPKLTALQIIQLILILAHSLQGLLPSCQLNLATKILYVCYISCTTMLIVLFVKFYTQNFALKQKKV